MGSVGDIREERAVQVGRLPAQSLDGQARARVTAPLQDDEFAATGGRVRTRIKSAQMAIKDQLTREIINGTLSAGARLTQAELAQRFGVSLAPVREALRELDGDGLVEIDPFTGATVHRPSLHDLKCICDMRLKLEPLAFPARAGRPAPEVVARADDLIVLMARDIDSATWTVANREFHDLLRSGCRNKFALQALNRLDNLLALYVSLSIVNRKDANDEHAETLDAYRNGRRSEVVRITKLHIQRTYEACVAVLESSDG
jgi:DNA-binding GntR family transcriptional regulator